jgi:DNA-binding response OmpR family regulator
MPRLLLIEDDNPLRRALADLLVRRGYEVFDAADGKTGLNLAFSCQPDIILCDIDLPGVNGFTVLNELNQRGVLAHSTLYFMTGHPVDMFALQEATGNVAGFIMKPFDVDELLKTISSYVRA